MTKNIQPILDSAWEKLHEVLNETRLGIQYQNMYYSEKVQIHDSY